MPTEADLKRDLVATLLKEGGYGRRLEDKYAVGTLDLLLTTMRYVIYAEVKMLKGIIALPARVAQRREIEKFNGVGNSHARAIVIGYRDGALGFGLPGQRWDHNFRISWPLDESTLTDGLDGALDRIFKRGL